MAVMASLDGGGSSSCKLFWNFVLGASLILYLYSEGVVTIGFGIIFAAIMPEYPHKARLLKPIERSYALWRLEMEAGAGEANEEQSTLNSFKQAFLDPKIWALVCCMGMSQAMGITNNFFPSIVQTLGCTLPRVHIPLFHLWLRHARTSTQDNY